MAYYFQLLGCPGPLATKCHASEGGVGHGRKDGGCRLNEPPSEFSCDRPCRHKERRSSMKQIVWKKALSGAVSAISHVTQSRKIAAHWAGVKDPKLEGLCVHGLFAVPLSEESCCLATLPNGHTRQACMKRPELSVTGSFTHLRPFRSLVCDLCENPYGYKKGILGNYQHAVSEIRLALQEAHEDSTSHV